MHLRYQKGNKKLHITHYGYFFTFLLSYGRWKTYSQTSAQEISAILGHFHILQQ